MLPSVTSSVTDLAQVLKWFSTECRKNNHRKPFLLSTWPLTAHKRIRYGWQDFALAGGNTIEICETGTRRRRGGGRIKIESNLRPRNLRRKETENLNKRA